jgi:hypothetical protein
MFNKKNRDIGPGQFKLDPCLVSTGAPDSMVKEVVYEANILNTGIHEIIEAYTERNKIAIPQLNLIIEIQKQREKR